ncbi:MAG: NADH:flavin oxidoreductase [Flexilinea sp.]
MRILTTPLITPKIKLHNRLVLPPIATEKATADGYSTDAVLHYYDEKSRGGCLALIITEHCYVTHQGKASAFQLSVADDSTIEGWKRLADILHKNGVKAAMQINHAGSAADNDGLEIVGPSVIRHPQKKKLPNALTRIQIDEIIEAFCLAAGRAKAAGFDAVEIHSAHGYLLNQFYSPLTNQRADEFGGSLQNRIRIHLEIIRAVRAKVGEDYPLLLRLGGCDYMEGGSTLSDCVTAASAFEKAGLDILDISGGHCGFTNPLSIEPGYFSDMSLAVKQKIAIPVILTGGISTAEQAEALLENRAADLIGVGRAILRDSDWACNAVHSPGIV